MCADRVKTIGRRNRVQTRTTRSAVDGSAAEDGRWCRIHGGDGFSIFIGGHYDSDKKPTFIV